MEHQRKKGINRENWIIIMTKAITYRDYPNVKIVSTYQVHRRPWAYGFSVMLRFASDGHVSVFEDGKTMSLHTYGKPQHFLEDWQVINRKVLIEKVGFYI